MQKKKKGELFNHRVSSVLHGGLRVLILATKAQRHETSLHSVFCYTESTELYTEAHRELTKEQRATIRNSASIAQYSAHLAFNS